MAADERQNKMVGILIALLVAGAIGGAVYVQVGVVKPRLRRIQGELMEPYLRLRNEGKLQEAYEQYTTAAYREQFSLEDYKAYHAELQGKYGAVASSKQVNQHVAMMEKPDSVHQLHFRMQFERGFELMMYEIVRSEAGYRITGSHTEVRPGSLRPKPW